jgi:hypothetical protein
MKLIGIMPEHVDNKKINIKRVQEDLNGYRIAVSMDNISDYDVGLWAGWDEGISQLMVIVNAYNRHVSLPIPIMNT